VNVNFFTELADLLDRVSTFVHPLVLAGDLNLRLERQKDPHAGRSPGLHSNACNARNAHKVLRKKKYASKIKNAQETQ